MSGDIFGTDSDKLSIFSRRNKTSAQIISEAKASMCSGENMGSRFPAANLTAKLVTTSRPFTPKQTERQLYTTKARRQRPSSSVHLTNCIIEEEYLHIDDRPPSNLGGIKLVPIKVPHRSVSVDSFMGSEPLPSIADKITSPLTSPLASLRLPSIGSMTQPSVRQQFRRPLEAVKEGVVSPKTSVATASVLSPSKTQESVTRPRTSPRHSTSQGRTSPPSRPPSNLEEQSDFSNALEQLRLAQGDESVFAHLEKLITILGSTEVKASHRKSLMQVLSRHLGADNVLIMFALVDVMLLMRVSRNNLTLASKILFKLARDDFNDHQFEKRKTLELFLLALSRACPKADSEAFVYGYGALKFLTLNAKLVRILESLGFVHLSVIHLKVLCDSAVGNENETSNVLFQITSSLRNMLSSNKSKEDFSSFDGAGSLQTLVSSFKSDVDVACNVSRIMSVLSADEDICEKFLDNSEFVDSAFVLLKAHASRRDVVVRVTFCMGNLAAKCDASRLHLATHQDIEILPDLLSGYVEILRRDKSPSKVVDEDDENVDFGGSSGTVEDTCVKVIRVIANSSINPEAGSALALSEKIVDSLLRVAEAAAFSDNDDLLLPTLAALNNLSFYSIVHQKQTYSSLKPFLHCSNVQVVAETARVFGNLSRRSDIRMNISRDGEFSRIVDLLDSEDRDLVYATVGILINLMSDPQQRPLFRSSSGIRKSISVLERCSEAEDWSLASLVCQAIWNYSIEAKFGQTMDEETLRSLEDVLVYLLEMCNDCAAKKAAAFEDNILTVFQGEEREFCKVGLGLLKRIMDDCPRQIELLLDDD